MIDGNELLKFIDKYNLWEGEFTLITHPSLPIKQTHLKDLLSCTV